MTPKKNESAAKRRRKGGETSEDRRMKKNHMEWLMAVLFPFHGVPGLSSITSREVVMGAAANLFTVCQDIQDPDIYSADWADGCSLIEGTLVASHDTEGGEILSLFPVHAIGLKLEDTDDELMLFNPELDGAYFGDDRDSSLECRYDVPLLDEMTYSYPPFQGRRNSLFIDANPTRPPLAGWLGHLARPVMDGQQHEANCVLLPLAGTAPLCALVATATIPQGAELVRASESALTAHDEEAVRLSDKYYTENGFLRLYMNTAYSFEPKEMVPEESTFYPVNTDYPGLKVLHSSPDILAVENFLTDEECDRIIAKARPHLIPCLTKNAETGQVEVASSIRTSTNTNLPKTEAPTVVEKLLNLTNCDARQLKILQVLRYQEGQQFTPHTDGFPGPITACGFQHSGRLVTLFVYLNDVEEGGETRFTRLGLDVSPRKGMAVLHFPNTVDLEEDLRTEHEGVTAVDEKWLLVTWVWKHYRTDRRYGEMNDPAISEEDII